jgi:hypothetical protein
MNADEREFKTRFISAFIGVHRRLKSVFSLLAKPLATTLAAPGRADGGIVVLADYRTLTVMEPCDEGPGRLAGGVPVWSV